MRCFRIKGGVFTGHGKHLYALHTAVVVSGKDKIIFTWVCRYHRLCADDFVCCFQYKEDAEAFYERLKRRMRHFGLELEEEKRRLIEFGRFAEKRRKRDGIGKLETFSFLGLLHYCSKSRNGKFRVKRKTSRKKFAKKCRGCTGR